MIIKNKRAQNLLPGTTIFIILNILFFSSMLLFITQVGSTDNFLEKKEVRRIALAIDQLKPGTELVMDISELCKAAEKNNFNGNIVTLADSNSGMITVRVANGDGNSFRTFTKLEIGSILVDSNKRLVTIKA